ncbi:hypothetical protein BGE01nite_01870 [Brevifollis gellanilyticus]|uniref:Uncharacterized protein n=1 Tax=Brevifollis gellanilyticus TaxID=748831 RepID=A0A512M2D1_9BACT|nr:hypothetical protein BGE01nite_01870 [Brevifollis gellanilyticus]
MLNGSMKCVLRKRNVNESIERLKKDHQLAFLDHVLVTIKNSNTKTKHRQSHGHTFLITTSRPRYDWPSDRSLRHLKNICVDYPGTREVWQNRIGIIRASIKSLFDRGQRECKGTKFLEATVDPHVNGSDDWH